MKSPWRSQRDAPGGRNDFGHAICQIKPGTRLRAFLVARVGSSPDGDEEEARELFEIAVAPEVGNSPTLH